ncbi:MAG: 3-methylaspartate ammonia-lyase, partial [Clostridia bacterium]|nr:3-methylaspartate ammonia-lyase [Clostridia bacterium]
QEIADMVCALARSRMLHCDYAGRKSTAGNLAFPFSPSDIHVGPVYAFSVFHLAKVDSLLETAEILTEVV